MLSPELPAGGERASRSGLQDSAPRNKLGEEITSKVKGQFTQKGAGEGCTIIQEVRVR